MLRLILGLIHPETGDATIETRFGVSVPMNADTRHLFSYVPQGNSILSGTIAENMRMAKEDATDEEIVEALKAACAWDFVEKKPDGINTKIGERGRGFSEGQAQRIAIARALLREGSVMLFDEATSALDPETERQLLQNILAHHDKTILFITHRPAVVDYCDQVLHIEKTLPPPSL